MAPHIKNIVLDFGHGGLTQEGEYTSAPSKMHVFENGEVAYEGHLNRRIGGTLYNMLLNHIPDLNVICTVDLDDPTDLSLEERVNKEAKLDPKETIFVSIHCNAFNTEVDGFEIFTSKGDTYADHLAESIANSLESFFLGHGTKLRYDLSDGDKDKERNFYVLRKTRCPAVLIECLFFDNLDNYEILKDPFMQNEIAGGIYRGILNYIGRPFV